MSWPRFLRLFSVSEIQYQVPVPGSSYWVIHKDYLHTFLTSTLLTAVDLGLYPDDPRAWQSSRVSGACRLPPTGTRTHRLRGPSFCGGEPGRVTFSSQVGRRRSAPVGFFAGLSFRTSNPRRSCRRSRRVVIDGRPRHKTAPTQTQKTRRIPAPERRFQPLSLDRPPSLHHTPHHRGRGSTSRRRKSRRDPRSFSIVAASQGEDRGQERLRLAPEVPGGSGARAP
jgi:hypothetical protein